MFFEFGEVFLNIHFGGLHYSILIHFLENTRNIMELSEATMKFLKEKLIITLQEIHVKMTHKRDTCLQISKISLEAWNSFFFWYICWCLWYIIFLLSFYNCYPYYLITNPNITAFFCFVSVNFDSETVARKIITLRK